MKAPRASCGLLVYLNLDPHCHIGPASKRTLDASHVSNPVVISKEKAESYLMRRSNSSPPTKVHSVTYYRKHPRPPFQHLPPRGIIMSMQAGILTLTIRHAQYELLLSVNLYCPDVSTSSKHLRSFAISVGYVLLLKAPSKRSCLPFISFTSKLFCFYIYKLHLQAV